jgi:hypothetical protein
MLRRYLITNVVSTALLYSAFWALVPSPVSVSQALNTLVDTYVMGDTFLGPVLTRVIMVGANIATLF